MARGVPVVEADGSDGSGWVENDEQMVRWIGQKWLTDGFLDGYRISWLVIKAGRNTQEWSRMVSSKNNPETGWFGELRLSSTILEGLINTWDSAPVC